MVTLDTEPIVSGPSKTERLGTVLGIDVGSPDILLVVSRRQRVPRASILVTTAAQHMIRLSKAGEKVDSILVTSSQDDPTTHPEFREITENLRDLRNKWFPKAKLCVLCENAELDDLDVRAALSIYDRPIVSLEWGTTKTYAALTKRKSTVLTNMMRHLKVLEHVVVQARFVRGNADNSTDNEVKGWIKRLDEVRPREVQILLGKPGGRKDPIRPAPKSRVQQIAAQVTEKTGIPANVYSDEPLFV